MYFEYQTFILMSVNIINILNKKRHFLNNESKMKNTKNIPLKYKQTYQTNYIVYTFHLYYICYDIPRKKNI